MRILLSRTDSIGDVILTLPMAGLIKEKFPEAEVVFLGKTYTKDIVACSKHVDKFLDWSQIEKLNTTERLELLEAEKIDCFIHVFPNKEIAKWAYRAKIKQRVGTSHRAYHYLYCNQRYAFSRKRSDLHEAVLNTTLLKVLGIEYTGPYAQLEKYYGFENVPTLSDQWKSLLSRDSKNIILHTKSKGSAREWGLTNFRRLAEHCTTKGAKVFLTGTEDEGLLFRGEILFDHPNLIDLSGKMTLNELIAFIAEADTLVAASTGPLHIAASTGSQAIGIYPPIRPMHPGRWAPIGKKTQVLVQDNPQCKDCLNGEACQCMQGISAEKVMGVIFE